MSYIITISEGLTIPNGVYAAVQEAFQDGVKSGHFPADRPAPKGFESCAVARLKPNGDIIGIATYFPITDNDRPGMWIDLVYVWPGHRRRGLGKMLIARITESMTPESGSVQFGTDLNNFAMRYLGETSGFKVDGVIYRRAAVQA